MGDNSRAGETFLSPEEIFLKKGNFRPKKEAAPYEFEAWEPDQEQGPYDFEPWEPDQEQGPYDFEPWE